MIHQEGDWLSQDGINRYWQEWKSETRYTCGVVLLVHGLGEHSGRYTHVAEAFTNSGYVLLGFDQRGHGRSGGARGDDRIDETCQDISHFLEEARRRYPDTPVFLYGHSMGGLMVLYYSLTAHPDIAGVIATAPALAADEGVSPMTILTVKVLSRITPGLQINNGLDCSALSRKPEVVERYKTDPLVHGKITVRLGRQMLEASKWVRENKEFPLPLLLMCGSSDRIIDPEAVRQFGSTVKGDITVNILDGFFHEVHNEPDQKIVLKSMVEWMDRTSAARRK